MLLEELIKGKMPNQGLPTGFPEKAFMNFPPNLPIAWSSGNHGLGWQRVLNGLCASEIYRKLLPKSGKNKYITCCQIMKIKY